MYDDSYLINKIKEGNYNAFNLLIHRYESYVYTILRRMLTSKEDAEEAFQDTFMKVYRSIDKYQDSSKFSSWVFKIAYNTGLDYIKKTKRTDPLEGKEYNISTNENIEADISKKELRKSLVGLIEKLGEGEQVIMTMYYFEEMTIKEMAEITTFSETNIKTKLHRARKKIRAMITGNLKDEILSYRYG